MSDRRPLPPASQYTVPQLLSMARAEHRALTDRAVVLKRGLRALASELTVIECRLDEITDSEAILVAGHQQHAERVQVLPERPARVDGSDGVNYLTRADFRIRKVPSGYKVWQRVGTGWEALCDVYETRPEAGTAVDSILRERTGLPRLPSAATGYGA